MGRRENVGITNSQKEIKNKYENLLLYMVPKINKHKYTHIGYKWN